jgi:cell pole-organizing protein PopZ
MQAANIEPQMRSLWGNAWRAGDVAVGPVDSGDHSVIFGNAADQLAWPREPSSAARAVGEATSTHSPPNVTRVHSDGEVRLPAGPREIVATSDGESHHAPPVMCVENMVANPKRRKTMTFKTRALPIAAVLSLALVGTAVADFNMEAGPIFNQREARTKCAAACKLTWNGQWTTTVQGKMSVCGATNGAPHKPAKGDVPVGPIFSQAEAKAKCEAGLAKVKWNGQWLTTVQGQMSVCGCTGEAK